jgi:hypothetical protein
MIGRADVWGWESSEARASDGAVESEQRARVDRLVVPLSDDGARRLAGVYWQVVGQATFGLVRARDTGAGLELRLLGRGPALLRFGPARVSVGPDAVGCTHAITGGLLSRTPSGLILFEQRQLADCVLLVSSIAGFHPRLAARPGAPVWTGELYKRVQARLHVAIGRRYFARLATEAPR